MNKELKKARSKKATYKEILLALLILAMSFLPYLHDFDVFKGVKGFSGFSSLRIGIWATSLFVVAISGWVFAFLGHKGKSYRFVILAPIFMLSFQLAVYLLDARKTTINDFNWKVVINLIFALFIIVFFYWRKSKPNSE